MRPRSMLLAVVIACLATPAVAGAQFGSILKDKAKKAAQDAVDRKARGASADTASAVPAKRDAAKPSATTENIYWEDVVELTEPVMARLTSGFQAGAGVRDSLLAVARDEERWPREQQECMMRVAQSDEYQRRMSAAEGKSDAEQQKAMQAAGAWIIEKCGDGRQAERAKQALDTMPVFRIARVAGLTNRQVSIARERLEPFCASPPAPPSSDFARIPGQGGKFFVYNAAEHAAIRPRCAELVRLFAKL